MAEVGLDGGADEGAAVHHFGEFLEAFGEIDSADRGGDGGKSAADVGDGEAFSEGLVVLGVEGVGCGHASGHPDEDAAVGLGGGLVDRFVAEESGCAHGEGGGGCGTEFFKEVPAVFEFERSRHGGVS